jgi:hypothetical protein
MSVSIQKLNQLANERIYLSVGILRVRSTCPYCSLSLGVDPIDSAARLRANSTQGMEAFHKGSVFTVTREPQRLQSPS